MYTDSMSDLLQYLIESDAHFYRDYALPIIHSTPLSFDLDNFTSIVSENRTVPTDRTITEAFRHFEQDKRSQYEMHPHYGRYVWDIADQWYQKWNIVFSVENMWNWMEVNRSSTHKIITTDHVFDVIHIQPWLNRIASRYQVYPSHMGLLRDICRYIGNWHKANRIFALNGVFKLNSTPFYPPTWFTDKLRQNKNNCEGLSPSYLAHFVPPYKLHSNQIPERWHQVFLKGLTVDPHHNLTIDPALIFSAQTIIGLTVHYDEEAGYSKLMLVIPKAKYGNLENHIEQQIPTDYLKPCQLALSISKNIKDLHWNYVHGNIHPRNILLNNADYLGELSDITFMQRTGNSIQNRSSLWPGRWPYVAPEVVSTGLTTASDIYALGIILWQLISRITFPDDALVDPLVYRIEPIPGILKEYEDIYVDCLNMNPTKRPNAYTVDKRLHLFQNKLQNMRPTISQTTLDYIHSRKTEIDHFLSVSRISSPPVDHPSSVISTNDDDENESVSSSTTSSNILLAQVGDHFLTASITRPYHQRLKSYPNLIQSFPHCL
ncbi:kinase-like domain-containing protein [Pilobolus umbonatus]|nr:kinase-like domain-containing protein [Pilobolus umbonatus]